MKMLKLMKGLVRYLILMVIFSITQVVCELYLPSIMSNVVDIGISSANTDYIFSESFKMIIIAIVGLISNIFAFIFFFPFRFITQNNTRRNQNKCNQILPLKNIFV